MSARTAFRLTVIKGSPGPALLALPGRRDRVELVELASGETILMWEGHPLEVARLARTLRRDLATMDADRFRTAWLEDSENQTSPPTPR